MRRAERGAHFCRKHGEAVNGAVLGMCMAGLLDGCAKESRSSNKSKSPDAIKTPPVPTWNRSRNLLNTGSLQKPGLANGVSQ
jgi:hypothetical protein